MACAFAVFCMLRLMRARWKVVARRVVFVCMFFAIFLVSPAKVTTERTPR